jgi:hypothetical protein
MEHKCVNCHKLFDIKNDDDHKDCVLSLLKEGKEGGIYIQSYDEWISESKKYYEKTKPKPKTKKIIRVTIKKSNV